MNREKLQDPNLYNANGNPRNDSSNQRFIGQPPYVIYDYKNLGVWQTSAADQARKYGSKPGQIKVENMNSDGKIDAADRQVIGSRQPRFEAGQTIDLKGDWQYKLGATLPPTPGTTTFQYQPGGLFNGMIAPVLPYAVKGVLWYQGESNAGHPQDYQALLTGLIQDWRTQLKQPALPFIYAQLPNFMAVKKEPGESGWAALRDAQRRTLAVPHTGMATLLDIGEWNDIHPSDKKTVGHRLALAAQKAAYGDAKVVSSGPLYQAMSTTGNKLTLRFTSPGSALVAKGGGPLTGFAVAGADQRFVWAQARIEGDKVVVWSDQVPAPVAVRYAWADNPEGVNLYNQAGLPASTFTTER